VRSTLIQRPNSLTNRDKSLNRFSPCYLQSPLLIDFTPPPPPRKSGLKLVCSVNILYGNLKSANSQDYAQKPQRNCTFMNSPSGKDNFEIMLKSWIFETYSKCKYLYIALTVHAYIIFCVNLQTVSSCYNKYNRSPVLYV
jgi:hypothetical protein